MRATILSWFKQSRYPHAAAVGVLWALAFPQFDVAGLAWMAPALLLAVSMGTRGTEAFRLGFVAGFAHYLVSLYWLLLIPVAFFPIIGWLALSAFLALYPGLWTWLAWRFWPANATDNANTTPGWLPNIGWPSWGKRAGWMWLCSATWVAVEMGRARILGGFPWSLLGVSQYKLIPLIQVASVTGVYGVSFLVALVSLGIFCAGLGLLRSPWKRYGWLGDLMIPLCVTLGAFGWGLQVLKQPLSGARELHVAVVQPSIPQTMIWDTSANAQRFQQLLAMTEDALAEKPDLLLWPEAAVPELLRWDKATYEAVTGLARSNAVWMILGADDAVPLENTEDDALYYNCAWLVSPEGRITAVYRKRQLVAFGEEVPFSRWLPFLKWFTPITGSFTRGEAAADFSLPNLSLHVAPLICFEDVFPHLVRASVNPDTDLLVNLTNDGWFRESAAQWQHAANAVFRTVETGLPMVRCTNNGLTCEVDRRGRITAVFSDQNGSVYGTGWDQFTVPLPPPGFKAPTFYVAHGDWFGWGCMGLSAGGLLLTFVRRRPPATA